jgi:hypothetical protein
MAERNEAVAGAAHPVPHRRDDPEVAAGADI